MGNFVLYTIFIWRFLSFVLDYSEPCYLPDGSLTDSCCFDGILNGQEENIDCGGTCGNACDSCLACEILDCYGVCYSADDADLAAVKDECGVCDGNNTACVGCLDTTACNYDQYAILESDYCTYPIELYDCFGNCIQPDCEGECGGAAELDACGVCEGYSNTCDGCTDEGGCNYDDTAVFNDDSCYYPKSKILDCFDNCLVDSDCDGECGGTKVKDSCGICGGEDKSIDCAGKCSGTSEVDICDVCGGDSSSCVGCTDSKACNYFKDALYNDGSCYYVGNYDCNGKCIAGTDCNGICGGWQEEDECGVCGGFGMSCTNDFCVNQTIDCAGECEGSHTVDDCGICGKDGYHNFALDDCDDLCSDADCFGICGGSSTLDECDVCGGNGATCAEYEYCTPVNKIKPICNNSRVIASLSTLRDSFNPVVNTDTKLGSWLNMHTNGLNATLKTISKLTSDTLVGVQVLVVTLDSQAPDGFPVFSQKERDVTRSFVDAGGSVIIFFGHDAEDTLSSAFGSHSLFPACLSSDSNHCGLITSKAPTELLLGPFGIVPTEVCWTSNCHADQSLGSYSVSIIATDDTIEGSLISQGSIVEPTGLRSPNGAVLMYSDFNNSYSDWTTSGFESLTKNSFAYLLNHSCSPSNIPVFIIGCDGVCNSGKVKDDCGVCGGDNSKCTACPDSTACSYDADRLFDDESLCTYPEKFYSCAGVCDAESDCNGDCGGTAVKDICGVCDGKGSTMDCDGVCSGTSIEDECGVCNGDGLSCTAKGCTNSTACNYNEDSTIDDGTCWYALVEYGIDYDCFGNCMKDLDCKSVCGGSDVVDDCGVCGAKNADIDCFGNCFGGAVVDDCGVCDGDSSTCDTTFCADGTVDCAGICDGSHYYYTKCSPETCQAEGETAKDCTGVCFGPAKIDGCGVCEGDGSSCVGCADKVGCNFGGANISQGGFPTDEDESLVFYIDAWYTTKMPAYGGGMACHRNAEQRIVSSMDSSER